LTEGIFTCARNGRRSPLTGDDLNMTLKMESEFKLGGIELTRNNILLKA